ncbi:MAG: PQQ-binding-like beta-propeller repeat protein [Porphyrobacter sp.]|nr:PQQ-binding-like beta-propeller repeat protein [Porphyrobacter sp.]
MRVAKSLRLATGLLLAASTAAIAQDAIPDGDWQTINRDAAATRYSPLKDVNRSNVTSLTQTWEYPLKSFNTAVPVVVEGTMFFPAGNRIVALDADTGQERWVYTIPPAGEQPRNASTRGVGYWPGEGSTPARILVMAGSTMLALDAATGQPSAGFGEGGMTDVGVSYGGSVTIADDVAIIGAATLENPTGVPGNPRAFDVRTGRKLWEFQTVPQAGQPHNETWGNGWKNRSGTNMWGFAAPVDLERGIVILPISGPSPNYWGGERPGTNLYGNSLVAVDFKTGEYKWHYQTVHHDIWDTDMPSAGPLINVTINGKSEPVIAHVGKSSLFYVIDRETGVPALPVEERAVPVGDVPGEYYHPTQPIPVNTPPLSRVSLTFDDIVDAEDTTPEHAAACRAMWDKAGGYLNFGLFTPFMYHQAGTPPRSTIQLPGGTGGVNWGGAAADPTTGLVYVNAQDTSLVGWVERKESSESYSFDANDTDQPYDRASVDGKGPFFSFSAPLSGQYDAQGRGVGPSAPCYKPPWGELVAVNANTGAIQWSVPLGVIDELPEGKRLVGNSGSAGPTVTAGGLVFVGATNDRRFRAFDAQTGQQLWEAQLKSNANANPMTYRGRSGKQYVAINAGGTIVSYSLSR